MELHFCQGARLWGLLPKVDSGGKTLKDARTFLVILNVRLQHQWKHRLGHRSRDHGRSQEAQLSGPSTVFQLRDNLKCLRPVATESWLRPKGQQQGFLLQ